MTNKKTGKSKNDPSEKTKWTVETTLKIIGVTLTITGIILGAFYFTHPWAPPDFVISANPMLGTVDPAGSIPFTIKLECLNGYQKDVLLTSSGEPGGIVITFDNPTLNSKQSLATITATVASNVPANKYEITFKGTGSDGKEHTLVYTLTVNPTDLDHDGLKPDFNISVSPLKGSVLENESIQTTLTVASIDGYEKDIYFSAAGLSSGINVIFDPSTLTLNPLQPAQSTVTVSVASNVPVGDYGLNILGTGSDGKKHDISYTLTVVSEPPPIVKITDPKGGDGVNTSITVEGTIQNVPVDQLWVFVRESNRYYPMATPAVIAASGVWSSQAYIGGDNDTGKQFTLYAVIANSTAQTQINAYNTNSKIAGHYPGMETLPPGAIIYDQVTVIKNPPMTAPSVNITYPSNGSTVSKIVAAQGIAQNIPSGQVIWAIVFVHSVSLYYPMPAAVVVQQDGSWQTSVTVGGPNDAGVQFDIILVVANQAGQSALVAYNQDAEKNHPGDYPGIPQIPPGLVEYSRVTVVRGPWT